ncbi:DNA-binding protein [Sphingomonas sp. TZW2008]|uniref:DNA-binding protein n=1 Tax=Sphingomonas sp. TZW2008 TaxID=1917973 RepID=UPI000A268CEF|nr:DNA-binding protein [Sphingomonas sp. TZW2008]
MAGELTRDDVFAACEALAAHKVPVEKITGHKAWSWLGRGSKTTVQKHVREWQALQEKSLPLTRQAAMTTIQETIDRLVSQGVSDERHRADLAIAQLEEQVRQLSLSLTSALADAERLTAQLNEVTRVRTH